MDLIQQTIFTLPVNKMPLNYCALGFNEDDNKMFQDAEQAIDKADKWEWLKTFSPDPRLGFVFSNAPEIDLIGHLTKVDHTGASFAYTMRVMQELAQEGIDEFCAKRSQRIEPEVKEKVVQKRTKEMDKKVIEEYNNVKPFKKVPKWASDYATLYPQVVANLKFM
jgi:hypothetical protein